jgi:hypothetical protein
MTTPTYPYMTRTTNARIAGFAFLFYIAVVVASIVLFSEATRAEGTAAKLASLAQHAMEVRVSVVLGLLAPFVAMVLSTALYAITREQDRFLAMLAMTCLFGAGVIDGIYLPTTLGLLSLATAAGANAPDPSAVYTFGSFLLTARVESAHCCDLFRGREHALRLAPPARAADPQRTGLAWRDCVAPVGGRASATARRRPPHRCHLVRIFTDGRVRDFRRAVATRQRHHHAARPHRLPRARRLSTLTEREASVHVRPI